jgi:hypothetical protein
VVANPPLGLLFFTLEACLCCLEKVSESVDERRRFMHEPPFELQQTDRISLVLANLELTLTLLVFHYKTFTNKENWQIVLVMIERIKLIGSDPSQTLSLSLQLLLPASSTLSLPTLKSSTEAQKLLDSFLINSRDLWIHLNKRLEQLLPILVRKYYTVHVKPLTLIFF